MIKKIFLFILLSLISLSNFCQTAAQNKSLLIKSISQPSPPRITLSWSTYATSTGYSIYRKLKTSSSWGSAIATLPGTSTQYVDNTPVSGTYYEYKISRSSAAGTANGYSAAGIEVQLVPYRGKIILVVDNTFISSLATELTQLENDLRGDGWCVVRQNVSRTASPSSIRTGIQTEYNSDPTNVKSVYLFGHIPVYRSGNINPDGHSAIPWACDSYYGEMNSTWSSSQTSLPSDVELQVGRVDLYNMTAFSQSETELLRNYLNKSHNFKIKQYIPQFRSLLSDNFSGWISDPLSEGGFRTLGALTGAENLTILPYYGSPQFWSAVTNGYLWTWSGGGGSYNSADAIGTTQNYVSTPFNGVFNLSFGSYFGNWDSNTSVPNWNNGTNNFLRAPLASGKALTNCFDAIPTWYFHHMGMGDPIGYSTLMSMNNRTSTPVYQPQNNGWGGQGYTTIHLSLMGDPSLRMQMVSPPTGLSISNVGNNFNFSWSASGESVVGYYLYEILSDGSVVLAHPNLIAGTSLNSSIAYSGNRTFMVRATKLQTSNTGTYYNLSLGSIATSQVSQMLVQLDIKVFLEGSINGSSMRDDLRQLGYIPLTQPYSSLGYIHTNNVRNESISGSILSVVGSSAIVDWILVELRSTPILISGSRCGLVRKDGKIVDMDGFSPLQFDLPPGSYYVVVKHRNHLGIMSSGTLALSGTSVSIDFTSASVPTYGTEARKLVGSFYCLWSGDSNFDGVLKYTGSSNDRDPVLVRIGGFVPTNTSNGYYNEDINMDGTCKYTGQNNDRDIILTNIGGSVPTFVKNQQIP